MNFIMDPAEIERRSFEIIGEKLGGAVDAQNINIIKRVIHTTADFDYAQNLVFSPDALRAAKDALTAGARLVTDTRMAEAGVNKKALEKLSCSVHCFIGDPAVAARASEAGITRAALAAEHAAKTLDNPLIFAVGNAPTALIKLHELVSSGALSPALIIAVPVGFVNVVESKELILSLDVPHIVAKGQKGGSNVAAAIINALLYELAGR